MVFKVIDTNLFEKYQMSIKNFFNIKQLYSLFLFVQKRKKKYVLFYHLLNTYKDKNSAPFFVYKIFFQHDILNLLFKNSHFKKTFLKWYSFVCYNRKRQKFYFLKIASVMLLFILKKTEVFLLLFASCRRLTKTTSSKKKTK